MTIIKYNSEHSYQFENYKSFDAPLFFCPLQDKHKPELIKAVWNSHKALRGFLGWAKYSRSWDFKTAIRFVEDLINVDLPSQHFVFTINEKIVGVGSLLPCYTPRDAQIALWVTYGYQGQGIGAKMVETLKSVAFDVWGYERLYYEHDAKNESSKRLPQKCGFTYSHSFDLDKQAELESGFWMSWVYERPIDSSKGILQGKPISHFTEPDSSNSL